MSSFITEVPDSHTLFKDTEFIKNNQEVADQWVSIRDLYPGGADEPLLPPKLSREQFAQGNHFECFMLSALATLVRFPDVIHNCFVTKKVRQDGRYTFQFFRGQQWVKVEIDDTIALEDDDVLYMQSPTEHWWPLLLEKAYAKFYRSYEQLEGCTLLETFHDMTGHPVQNIPMTAKLAKSAGVDIADGQYWLSMGESLQRGDYVASTLTKAADLETIGMQSEQQYAILEIFSLTGSSTLDDIVVHMHNPFEDEEFEYSGPLNKNDPKWTAKQRKQYPVDDRHSIFMPLNTFIKSANSIQYCFMHTLEDEPQLFNSEWKGPTAGGNPTYITWRKNPSFVVRNDSATPVKIVVLIQQEDQRRTADIEVGASYRQCGLVVVRPSYPSPIPTLWITGNNHRNVFKSLFLNSREVANVVTIPANSMCFMLPSTLQPALEAPFRLAVYRFKKENYSCFSIEPLAVPGINWTSPAKEEIQLREKEKGRVDFYVDEATDVHVLLHQEKPYVSKSGGDAMTEDYMGMYLYDDTDRKIGGVHAATNFREISVIQRAPRSGRYAVSLTCPRAKGDVPAYVTVVASHAANVRIVDPPEDATMFDDEDEIDEGNEEILDNPIDYVPIQLPNSEVTAVAESDTPYEERRFYMDNRGVTTEPWVHIGDLYPEGKTKPLLPDDMNHGQFEQGDHFDCSALTGFAALLDRHPDVIRNCFISKKPRKDGRYTFQFHRYGQWVKVEIDDRIPMIKGDTVFCRSPTHHWWPLLLEKAYAKFYTLYQNLEDISQEEVFHDFTGLPCLTVSTDPAKAKVNMSYFDDPQYWLNLADALPNYCMTAQASGADAEQYGLVDEQYYALLDIIPLQGGRQVSDILVKLFNPFEDSPYVGPMNCEDGAWTDDLINALRPENSTRVFFIPANHFTKVFASVQMGYAKGLAEPSWHFNSDWTQGTNGGNTSLISWRENPLYVFRNRGSEPVQVVAMVRQPDQRHLKHTLNNQELDYPKKGITVALANPNAQDIPTHLVTFDNHRLVHLLPLVSQREVANVLTFPPQSLCYVVGHLDGLQHSKFLLSYWYMHPHDTENLQAVRYKPTVAKHAPALAHVELQNRGKQRVDFLVDVPTDVHALLRQEKPFTSAQGGDLIAEDYLGVYVYDLQNNRIKGTQSAMNYRELSVVTHLDKPGHYVFFCTCPRGYGEVPCKVEICALEEAHVRITDPPDETKELEELDLAFLDPCPEGIPLAELGLSSDAPFQADLTALRWLHGDPSASDEEIQELKDRLNARAHKLAKAKLGQERPVYLPDRDLETLNPFLDESEEYMAAERERYELKKDPRNNYKIPAIEERLRTLADAVAGEAISGNIDFIDARPEGIPREDLPLTSDETFADLLKQRAKLLRRAAQDPQALADVEAALNERAYAIARAVHEAERGYLDPEPEGVPLALLPLNSDEEFCSMEDELRALLRTPPVDPQAVSDLQVELNERAHELARELKAVEREKFLNPEYATVTASVLDADPTFTAKEIQRLLLLHENHESNAATIRSIEEELNSRAAQLAELQKADERAFLVPYGVDIDVLRDTLDSDAEFRRKEDELRALRKNPLQNATAIKVLEEEMARLALDLDRQFKEQERLNYLQAEYEGRLTGTLPLNDDSTFRDAEAEYLKARASGKASAGELQQLQDAMDERATALAHEMNVDDRPKYLPQAVRGVPLTALPLDDDDEFHRMELARARAIADPKQASDVANWEEQLRARADELAHMRLSSDRGFLDPEPEGIPLSCLRIDEHGQFCAYEEQRAGLLASANAAANHGAVLALEESMNQQVHDMAKELKRAEIAECVPAKLRGIPRELLPLMEDSEATQLIATRATSQTATDSARYAGELKTRAETLAGSAIDGVRSRLVPAPLQIPLGELPLDDDEAFEALEVEAIEELQKPKPDAQVVGDLVTDLDKRAYELAEQQCWRERGTFLRPDPEGRPLTSLPLNTDSEFMSMEARRRAATKSANPDAALLRSLGEQMNERACELAREANRKDRSSYMPSALRGVAHYALPLDDDEEFRSLESRRAAALHDPKQKAKVKETEDALRSRAMAMAESYLRNDRNFLDARPEGVPLRQVPVDADRAFNQLEEQRAQLRSSSTAAGDAAKVKEIESQMNARAHELAKDAKVRLRSQLEQNVLGIPLNDLPLDADAAFNQLEEHLRDAEAQRDDTAQATLKTDLHQRAAELAKNMHDEERAPLEQTPEGVPLCALPLNTDAEFLALEGTARSVAASMAAAGQRQRNSDATKLAALQDQLNVRARELVYEGRKMYCDAEPEGLALESLGLAREPAFLKKEEERRQLLLQHPHGAPSDAVQSCERALNDMVHDIALSRLQNDRGYLDADPEGVALGILPLNTDPKFRAMEVERAKLKAQNSAAATLKIQAVEEKLNGRAHELARAQKEEDLKGLEAAPFGVPLSVLQPHTDPTFAAMVEGLRELKKNSSQNQRAIEALQAEMNERCRALAKARVEGDRGYLDPNPRGVPLSLLPLDHDFTFQQLEAQRANLKALDARLNAAAIREQERKLNDRAHELAGERIAKELEGVDPNPFGVPLEVLRPYEDPEFDELIAELRTLPTLDSRDAQVADLKTAMDQRCQTMARDLLEKDRAYLHKNPKEVPLSLLPLNSDEAFHAAEVRRAVLKADNPRRNAEKIAELENQLNVRAMELAEQRRAQDVQGLDATPEGVPLAVVNPHSDAQFAQLVDQRRTLELNSKDPAAAKAQLPALITVMNELAHDLARGMLQGDRSYLDRYPEGVPLEELPIDTDGAFHKMEVERTALKAENSKRNVGRIKELETKLNDRAHELARIQKAADLEGINPAPRGVPLELLKPHEDAVFGKQVQTLRGLKRNPPRDVNETAQHVAEMNSRADELAREVMDRAYLDPAPDKVPLEFLPLDEDEKFHAMEVERAKLKLTDPRRQASSISALEGELNQRALELAKRQRAMDLDAVDATPYGIPKELLNLHEDPAARELIDDMRKLRHNPTKNVASIEEKAQALNAQAHEVAKSLLTGERSQYLEPRPRGILLEDLPLDSDPAFHALEVERATLKATNPVRNAAAIRNTEGLLNDRACQLAEDVKDEDLAAFPQRYEGILIKDLKPHSDRLFSEAAENRRRRKRNPTVTFKEDLEQIMSDRLSELAREHKDGDLYFLDPNPHGVPLADLPLNTDAAFTEMREQRHKLRESDPMSNRKAINELEKDMNARASQMALAVLNDDFDGVDPKPLGIPLDLLEPRRDTTVAAIIPELRRTKRLPQLKSKVAELKGKLNERVQELAGVALEQGRDDYLDPDPEGVPLALLPLRTDEQFHGKEAKRATFRLQDAVKNAVAIEQLETQLNQRAHELAEAQRHSDLEGVDPTPRDIPLELLEPHEDPKMAGLIKDVRVLKRDVVRNTDKIKAQLQLMNNRALELATGALDGDREYLASNPGGVPLSVLPLDTDADFHKMEVARAIEKRSAHPDAHAIEQLEGRLNVRAEELAAAQLKRDLEGLEQAPLGVPLALLKPHQDSAFSAMLPELRRLAKDPSAHAAKLKQVRATANERDYELAEEYVAKDRPTYIEAEPEGLALQLLPLSSDDEFKQLEARKLHLQATQAEGGAVDTREIAKLEDQLRKRAREVALQQLRKDRGYLDPFPEGVPLEVLPLDTDPKFRELEAERATAKARNANTAAADLEDALNTRVQELALAQKEEDLRGLEPKPCGIPLKALEPHQDARFAQLVDELRRLKAGAEQAGSSAGGGDHGNAAAIAEVQEKLNERAMEMAEAVTKNDRRYLHPRPENMPLQRVPLDIDATFHALEVERATLKLADPKKNQHRIGELEDQLNDRAHELARQVKAADYKGLSPAPRGIPIELLNLHTDPKFSSLAEEKAQCSKARSTEALAPLVKSLNSCAEEAADKLLRGDRGYLDRDPEGVPLSRLPLDEDVIFNDLEVQRAILKAKDPVRNASSISDLEDQLNARAHVLAHDVLANDRGYLDPQPEGVPLEELPLSTDNKFHSMEVERAKLRSRDPVANAALIAELEGRLNDRATDLAKKQLEEDLQGLDREPEGYPLKYLHPHHDAAFAASVPALRAAKRQTPVDPANVREAQATLNARAHAIARERIASDRSKMDSEPEGVPLALLPLEEDAKFVQAEKEFRVLGASDRRNPAAAEEALAHMNERGHVLAKEYLMRSRGFLDQEPEGVPLVDVPLDGDATFRNMEKARLRRLASGEAPSSPELQAMEERLNDRAHELAREEKVRGRSFLRDKSFDIPRELLALDSDKTFMAKEKELRSALRNSGDKAATSSAVPALCRELQVRADEVGEAQLKGDRDKYLNEQPAGVDLRDIPLDEDEAFHAMELERAVLLATDPHESKAEVAVLEKRLNERAHELARQVVAGDRGYLPPEISGIPIDELPLDTDTQFKKLERQRRAHKRSPALKKEVLADEEELRTRANELANEVITQDLESLKPTYRGIPREELGLHADEQFRELAKKRRRCRGKGRVEATQMAALEDDMDRRAREIADDVIENERAFLDAEPEGMYLVDVPLDSDPTFQQLEQEYRRRSKDPRATKQNKEVLRELGEEMNRRSHTLAREEFARRREFMLQDPEGIPLWELGLDEDPEFKQEEITRYRNERTAAPKESVRVETAERMNERAGELARIMLAADRAFLDPEPEGVALELLPLDSDKAFSDLARERRRHKKALRGGAGEPEVRAVEERMNIRTHEMAKDFLEAERAFLSREPEGVPLEDLPLNSDAPFRALEKERLLLKREPVVNAGPITTKEVALQDRAEAIARELLRKERAFLDPEPLGVPLEELPLNHDPILNQVERKRRALRANPKRNHEGIRACEEQMAERVGDIALAFVEKQRSFLDQEPEGVPLRYLPLGTDRDFHEKELLHRRLLKHPEKNKADIAELEKKMNDRVHALATDLVMKGRAFLNPEPLGVPIADVPLNGDEAFRKMEEQRRALKEAGRSSAHIKAIEDKLNERAEILAQKLLDSERAFMDPAPLGIPLSEIPLNNDARMRTIERTRRQLRKEAAGRNAEDIAVLEGGMEGRAYELADELLASDRAYLHPEPCGVPLRDLPLHTDPAFHTMELQHFRGKRKGGTDLAPLEKKLNERLMELAAEFIKKDRAFLDQEPEGIPLDQLPLNADPVFHSMELERRQLRRSDPNSKNVRGIEQRMNNRVHELALEIRGWQDNEFHEANKHIAEKWPRVGELYPEGRYEPFEPTSPSPGDIESAPQDAGFIVPFLSALSRHPVLLQRLIATKEPPVNAPYTFVFFDPNSNPVYVDIDDRVPCTAGREPKFTQSPSHSWYPLLLEKAYAKFVGGYEQLDNCTPLETLRDLTGRPVTHTPFDLKLAEAANLGDSTSVEFWQGVAEDLNRGDVIVCTSSDAAPDGIHPLCSYALLDVIITLPGSTNPSDVVVKVEDAYRRDEPHYTGPLCHGDINWNAELQQVCRYDPERTDVLYLPLPTFLRNFSTMQTCHINCGDRLTVSGSWDSRTSGGNPRFTSFRNNPIYLLQNSSSRPATVLVELRHDAPQFVDPDGLHHYPQSGIVLMEPVSTANPATPLVTNSTAKFLQKGIMLDSREVCSLMEVPPSSTCWLIPYTSKVGQHGGFHVSVYPGFAKVSLTPMNFCGLSRTPTSATVTLSPGDEGRRVDFTVSAACEVHVLLRQEKISDLRAASKGDVIADDDVVMVAFNDQAMKITSSGSATNAREHSLAFKADKPGYYSLLLTSPNPPVTGDCPCTISIFTPKRITVKFVAPPVGARPLQQTRFPTLPKANKTQGNAVRRSRAPSTGSAIQRGESLPPLRNGGNSPGERAAASKSTPASFRK